MKTLMILRVFAVLVAALGCRNGTQDAALAQPESIAAPAAADDTDRHAELPATVTLADATVVAAGIVVRPVAVAVLPESLQLPGEVIADPDRSAQVAAAVAGRIERVLFQEGQAVRMGDPMVVLRVPELGKVWAARSGLQARAKANQRNATRLNQLADQGLAARHEALAAQAEADALALEAQALGQQMVALGVGPQAGAELVVRAPMDGRVAQRAAVVGQPVDAGHVFATLVDLSRAVFAARLFERDLQRVRVGAAASVTLNSWPQLPFAGTVEAVGLQLDTGARAVIARIAVTNRDDMLRIGLFGSAQVAIGAGTRPPRLLLPVGAIVVVNGQPTVFVRRSPGVFARHAVVLGEQALAQVEIVAGLAAGEQVVVDGAFTLLSALLRDTLAEED